MAGGTHVFDMIKRLKENKNLRTFKYFSKPRPPAGFQLAHEQKVSKSILTLRLLYRIVLIIGLISILILALIKLFSRVPE